MKYRKLRIAWSLLCGLIAVLLSALWVRSYWSLDDFVIAHGARRIEGVPRDKPFFEIQFGSDGIIYIPHRYLILLTAAFGMVPWLRWFGRFSLRTLLALTTLVAVVLGLIAAVCRTS